MDRSEMYSRLPHANARKRRRDHGLVVSLTVALLLTVLVLAPLVYGGSLLYRFHRFTQALAVSFVEGEGQDSITADYGGQTHRVSRDAASRLYKMLVDGKMGSPRRAVGDAEGVVMAFGEGSSLALFPSARPSSLPNGQAVLLRYSGADGTLICYENNKLRYESLLATLGLS